MTERLNTSSSCWSLTIPSSHPADDVSGQTAELSPIASLSLFSFFWLHRVACGILALIQGIEPAAPGVEAQSLNHWATREGPESIS